MKFPLTLLAFVLSIIPIEVLAITQDDVEIMRRSGVMIKMSENQRIFETIPENIKVADFLNIDAISFENVSVHTLPDFLFELKKLRELILKNTDLRVDSLARVGELSSLEHLDISGNPNFFQGGMVPKTTCYEEGIIFKSTHCYSSDVYEGGTLTSLIFPLKKLKILNVSDIGSYPGDVWRADQEIALDVNLDTFIAINSSFDFSSTTVFSHMDIRILDISGANLGRYSGGSISKLCGAFKVHGMKELSVADSDVPFLEYCSLDSLEYLNLSGNPISGVDDRYKSIFALPNIVSIKFDSGQNVIADFVCEKMPSSPYCQVDDLSDGRTPMSLDEFKTFTAGKTLEFMRDEVIHGYEYFAYDGTTIYYIVGENRCDNGVIKQLNDYICFEYEHSGSNCQKIFRSHKGLVVDFMNGYTSHGRVSEKVINCPAQN